MTLLSNGTSTGYATVTLNTQALPSGINYINNVQLWLDVAEANGGMSGSSPAATCDYGSTPIGGGQSGVIHGYPYGNCSNSPSAWVDAVQVGISAVTGQLPGAAPYSSNLPSSFNAGQTVTVGTDNNPLKIVMQNTGNLSWTSDTEQATGLGTGTCDYDTDGDGIMDSPDPNADNANSSCTVPYNFSSSLFKLQHAASTFSATPSVVSYVQPVQVTETLKCVSKRVVCGTDTSANPLLPSRAYAVSVGPINYCYINVCLPMATYSPSPVILTGQTATFPISSITAPSTMGSYTETWQMADSGSLFGTAFTQSINTCSLNVDASTPPWNGTFTLSSVTGNCPGWSTLTNNATILNGNIIIDQPFVINGATLSITSGRTITIQKTGYIQIINGGSINKR